MVNVFTRDASRPDRDKDQAVRPAELTSAQIDAVAGGLNPQPLPPRVEV
jgi:hypothetical protein